MSSADIIKVAQIRGNGLSDRETKTWEYFPHNIVQTVFATYKNVYSQSNLPFPIVKVHASSDTFLSKNFFKYVYGQYQRMYGLEHLLGDFDIVHAGEIYNYYTYQAVLAKNRYPRLKVVATVWENSFGRFEYNYWPGFAAPPKYWRDRINTIIQKNAVGVDMFLPATQDAAELLFDLGVKKEKIQVITPGVIPADNLVSAQIPLLLKDKQVYLMVNRMVREKGVYDCMYGWRHYLAQEKQIKNKALVLVGEGPELPNLKRMASDWGMLDKNIFFISQLPYQQVLALYRGAYCLVLGSIPRPTWQEQFGYVLAESICAGTPVLATNSGAIADVVGRAGFLVPPAHPVALSRAFRELDNKLVYDQLKQACVKERQKFDVRSYAQKITSVYQSLM